MISNKCVHTTNTNKRAGYQIFTLGSWRLLANDSPLASLLPVYWYCVVDPHTPSPPPCPRPRTPSRTPRRGGRSARSARRSSPRESCAFAPVRFSCPPSEARVCFMCRVIVRIVVVSLTGAAQQQLLNYSMLTMPFIIHYSCRCDAGRKGFLFHIVSCSFVYRNIARVYALQIHCNITRIANAYLRPTPTTRFDSSYIHI